MKKNCSISLALVAFLISVNVQGQVMNVMSFNIRYDTPQDSLNAWPNRSEKVISQILFHEVQVLGVQEALHNQVADLAAGLKNFRYTGAGRDDGRSKGEYAAIFYDTAVLALHQSSVFWLSLTPDLPGSKSWDAAITRIVTWGKFTHKLTGKVFFVFNTHFDHAGIQARKESALLLKQKVKAIAGDIPALILGDFNSRPFEDPILILTDSQDQQKLIDSKAICTTPHFGPTGTFNGFGPKERDAFPIDYIFLKGDWKVSLHATLSQTWEGRFSSDHFPVFARVSF